MEDIWEYHKETIRQLYLVDQLPLSTVASQLKNSHGFDRKVHQYHHKLKQWGFRKNLTQAERESLYQNLNKRKATNPDVSLSGVMLKPKRIKRLMGRVPVSSEWTRPRLPIDSTSASDALQLVVPELSRMCWFGRLPWFEFSKIHLALPLSVNAVSSISTEMLWDQSSVSTSTLTQITSFPTADLQSLIPEEYDGGHEKVIASFKSGDRAVVEQEAFKILLYKLSNKMLISYDADPSLSDVSVLKMIRSVVDKNPEWLNSVLDSGSSTAIAIAEHLFAAAVRQVDFLVACRLLNTKMVCPNGRILATPQYPKYTFTRGSSVIEMSFTPETIFCTPLQMAISTGNKALVKALLHAGADVNPADDCVDLSALELACSLESASLAIDLVERLLRHGAAVNRPLLVARPTALMIAVAHGNAALVTLLLAHGSDTTRIYLPKNSAELELSAIRLAVLRGDLTVLDILMTASSKCGQSLKIDPDTMVLAISARNHDAIRCLVRAGTEAHGECSWGEHPLTTAIFMEDVAFDIPTAESYQWRDNRPSPMHAAAFRGLPDLISLLHNKGFSVTASLSYDSQEDIKNINTIYSTYTECSFDAWETLRTPLQVALYRRHVAAALMILDLGGNEFCGGEIALAARIGSSSLIHALVKHGAAVNGIGTPPFQTALEHQNIGAAHELLILGASIADGDLTRAIMSGDSRLLDWVWHLASPQQRQSLGPDSVSPLEAACATGNREWFCLILSETWARYDSAALCASVWYALGCCKKAFDFEEYIRYVIKPLLRKRKRRRRMDSIEATALTIAIKYRHVYEGILHTILGYFRPSPALALDLPTESIVPDFWWRKSTIRQGKSPLHTAIHENSFEVVTLLLEAGFELDEGCLLETLLLSGTTENVTKITAAILNARHPSTWSESLVAKAFERALESRQKASVDKLLELELPVNSRKDYDSGWTPLQFAVLYSDNAMVQKLIGAGADVNAYPAPRAGATALQIAAISNKMDIVRTLLEHGADVNAVGARSHGRTALEGAAEYGRQDMVQLLLYKGAKTGGDHRVQYLRAIKFAERSGHLGVVGLLKKHRRWTLEDVELMNAEHLMNEDTDC